AKQVMIQKIREAERDTLFDEYMELRSQLVSGLVTRVDRGTVIVNLGKLEAILPRSEQIPRETYRVGDRVRAGVLDVRKAGSRVRVILSRTHADFVRRLFEVEIPEINDRVIEVRSIAREAGHRSKVAVSCSDTTIDCVGACVGVRGARIRGIVEELGGERIDIVRWNDSLQILVPNALQPAEVEDVILCPMLGKVIVLVRDDQLSLAIGKRGQNVRLASKLVGWDINVMTQESLDQQLDRSIEAFTMIPQVSAELAENLVSQGFFTFDDLSVIEPDQLMEISGLSEDDCDQIVEFADAESLKEEERERIEAELRKQAAHAPAERPEARQTDAPAAGEDTPAEQAVSTEATEELAADEETAEAAASEVVADESATESEAVVDEAATDSESVGSAPAAEATEEEAADASPAEDESEERQPVAEAGIEGEASAGAGE
ncbi:MAG: transcription termination factor NusA, partial [Planctomycetaceae bacterium]|nr:transcription termination factor NusA [Planctomycetaceae bacterium]